MSPFLIAPSKKSLLISHTLCLSLCLMMFATQAFAKTPEDYANILNQSGKQRMLTQKMSKEMLFIAKGINITQNQTALAQTVALFDKTLNGLANGDASLKLPAADSKTIIKVLGRVTQLWSEFKPLTIAAAAGEVDIAEVATLNLPLLKNSNTVVRLYEKEARTATGKVSGIVINLAGKQRMLTQKMSKESILIALGHESSENQAKLRSTISLFDRTLKGLKSGNADLELPTNSQPQILAQLAVVEQLWVKLKPTLEAISTGMVTDSDLHVLYKANLPLLKEMNKAVSLFEKTSV